MTELLIDVGFINGYFQEIELVLGCVFIDINEFLPIETKTVITQDTVHITVAREFQENQMQEL